MIPDAYSSSHNQEKPDRAEIEQTWFILLGLSYLQSANLLGPLPSEHEM
jgi:hypothetical protein